MLSNPSQFHHCGQSGSTARDLGAAAYWALSPPLVSMGLCFIGARSAQLECMSDARLDQLKGLSDLFRSTHGWRPALHLLLAGNEVAPTPVLCSFKGQGVWSRVTRRVAAPRMALSVGSGANGAAQSSTSTETSSTTGL